MSKYADITLPGLIACVVLVCSLLLLGCASSKKSFLTEDYYGVTNNPSDPIGWATTFQPEDRLRPFGNPLRENTPTLSLQNQRGVRECQTEL